MIGGEGANYEGAVTPMHLLNYVAWPIVTSAVISTMARRAPALHLSPGKGGVGRPDRGWRWPCFTQVGDRVGAPEEGAELAIVDGVVLRDDCSSKQATQVEDRDRPNA